MLRVFENRVLRRIFGPKRDKVTEDWKTLHNEEHNNLYCSPNFIWVIKSRRMRWVEHVWVQTGFQWGDLRERYHLEDPDLNGRIILKWILRHWIGGHGLDWSGLEHGNIAGFCECGNEPSGTIKCGEFFD
jgi:hypothetical protein